MSGVQWLKLLGAVTWLVVAYPSLGLDLSWTGRLVCHGIAERIHVACTTRRWQSCHPAKVV